MVIGRSHGGKLELEALFATQEEVLKRFAMMKQAVHEDRISQVRFDPG